MNIINQIEEMATNKVIQFQVEMKPFEQFDRVAIQVMDTFEPLIRQLIERRDALLRELQKMKDNYYTKESTRKAAREELLATLQHLQLLKVNENIPLHRQTNDMYEERIRQLEAPTTLPRPYLLHPTLNELKTAIAEFGEVKQWELDYSLKKQPVLAVGKRGSADKELSSATGIALDEVNQLIYIVDRNNRRIQVVSYEGNFLKRFGQDVLKYPWGIAVTDDSVFVTDVDLQALLKFKKTDYQQVMSEGAEEGQLNVPRGLCIDCDGDVYVAEFRNNRVSVFSPQLEILRCFGNTKLKYPQDVKVTQNSVVVLDWSPDCIHFYSRNGEFQSSCVTHGEGGMVSDPYFFCCDTAENILITDRERHEIKILSPSGDLICTIGKKGNGKGEFQFPYGICVSKDGVIFVTSWNSSFGLQSF